MRGEVPKLAHIALETVTPMHIGGGQGGGKPFEDECLQRMVPNEYSPPPPRDGVPEFVKQYRGWRDREGTPYIPGSSLRGCLRALYTGALDANHVRSCENKADEIFGSTDEAGAVALDDLLPRGSVRVFETRLVRYLRATEAAGGEAGRSPSSFPVELVDKGASFKGRALYVGDTLPQMLQVIFAQADTLVEWLCTGSDKRKRSNPERTIPDSPIYKDLSAEDIRDKLFERKGDRWTITWKLGRYAKSYAKALSRRRHIGLPHAYYLVQGTQAIPGWVRITFDLSPHGAEFRLNQWPTEENG